MCGFPRPLDHLPQSCRPWSLDPYCLGWRAQSSSVKTVIQTINLYACIQTHYTVYRNILKKRRTYWFLWILHFSDAQIFQGYNPSWLFILNKVNNDSEIKHAQPSAWLCYMSAWPYNRLFTKENFTNWTYQTQTNPQIMGYLQLCIQSNKGSYLLR